MKLVHLRCSLPQYRVQKIAESHALQVVASVTDSYQGCVFVDEVVAIALLAEVVQVLHPHRAVLACCVVKITIAESGYISAILVVSY